MILNASPIVDVFFVIERRDGLAATGTLSWPAAGLRANVRSGPHGKGCLPDGLYRVDSRALRRKRSSETSFCDRAQPPNAWFQPITPLFSTRRSAFGIHPDGGVEGTRGCVGIVDSNTSAWLMTFEQLRVDLVLEVFDRPPRGRGR